MLCREQCHTALRGCLDKKAEVSSHVHMVMESILVSATKVNRLQIVIGMPSADSLSVADGTLLKANEITIPAILIKEVMQKLHQGHLDIKNNRQERLWVLARPKPVTKQTWCPTCRSQSRQQKKPMIPVLAQQPWKRVSVDFYLFFSREEISAWDSGLR